MTAQLNTLIRLRQYDVDRGQIQLASLQQQERELLGALEEMDRHIEHQRSDMDTLSSAGQLNIDALRLRWQYVQQLITRRTELQTRVSAAQANTRECRARLVAADQRLQVVKKLRERALAAERVQDVKQDAIETEEAWQAGSVEARSILASDGPT